MDAFCHLFSQKEEDQPLFKSVAYRNETKHVMRSNESKFSCDPPAELSTSHALYIYITRPNLFQRMWANRRHIKQ